MRKHLEYMGSQGVAPDISMFSFVLAVCAEEASASAAFATVDLLQQIKVRKLGPAQVILHCSNREIALL